MSPDITLAAPVRPQRAHGRLSLAFRAREEHAEPRVFFQSGAAKVRLPKMGKEGPLEAVLINTAGGVTGGDRFHYDIALDDGVAVTMTTAASEKVYRAASDHVEIDVRLRAGNDARLEWLPQETILFDGARLRRRFRADLTRGATLLALESVIFGRTARGERVHHGLFRDEWRIFRDGHLIFADSMRLEGAVAVILRGPAVAGVAQAVASLLYIAEDAAAQASDIRNAMADMPDPWGVSAWNGLLLFRLVAPGGEALRRALAKTLGVLRRDGLPHMWNC